MIITHAKFKKISKVVKLSAVCKLAGIPPATIWDRIQRGADLTQNQSDIILKTLERHGVQVNGKD